VTKPAGTMSIVALHLLPGIAVFGSYLLAAPLVTKLGAPQTAALLLAFMIVGMPLQLAIMKRHAMTEGKTSIREMIAFRQPQPVWLTMVLVVAAFALSVGMLAVFPFDRVSAGLADNLFWWLPAAARPSTAPLGLGTLVLATLILQILIDGIVNPIVEEVYFRGFLLPRLSHLGWLAPLVSTALFTLAHLWQPHNYVTIFALVLPLTFITWWRKNIYVQLIAHCLANTIGAVMALLAYGQP
jgi:membrane protease YdiL (CAAX protease family)